MIFCRVLGSIDVEVDGAAVELGGPIPRRMLTALSINPDTPVTDDAVAELVWRDDGPTDIGATLRVVVHRLRQALKPYGPDVLQRTPQGYLLAIPTTQVDHCRFAELVEAGVAEQRAGADGAAAKSFEAALALWRGQPWDDLGEPVRLAAARSKLTELRDVAVEELQAARLACGDTARAVAALSEAVIAAPYRERRWALLALALYQSGRQGHALAELRRFRQLLVEDLGIEPGPELRRLEQRMLDQDPALLAVESPTPPDTTVAQPVRAVRAIAKPPTTLFGREDDLAAVPKLFSDHRMVSLVGPAGVGKTRLALEHAAAHSDASLVRFADVHSAQAIAPAIAAAIGLTYVAGDPLLAIERAISDRPVLLVLDNCEHLSEPVAEVTAGLLASCRWLRVLATSRQVLNVEGEQVMPLHPLAVETAAGDGPAVALLLDRVGGNRTDWQPSAPERDAARQICAAVDGLPLAIELSAARERAYGLTEIASQLRDRLDVLGETPRGSISVHRSLQAALGWSIDQLPPAEKDLLLRLWPFEGGFTWQAADAVQPDHDPAAPVVAILAALVDRSVIAADLSGERARYRMLETLRRYTESEDPDPAATRVAHAAWARAFAAEQASLCTGPRAPDAFRALEADLANIRAGITHDLDRDPLEALRTTGSLFAMWVTVGAIDDGIRLMRSALDACPDAPAPDRARALVAWSMASLHAGDAALSLNLADQALELLDDCADSHQKLLCEALCRRCSALLELERPAEFRQTNERLVQETRHGDAPEYRALAELGLGIVHLQDGDPLGAAAAFDKCVQLSRECGFLAGEGLAEHLFAWGILRQSPRPRTSTLQALRSLVRAVSAFERGHDISDALAVLYAGAFALADLGETGVAARLRTSVLEHAHRVGTNPCRYAGPDIDSQFQRLLGAPDLTDQRPPVAWPAAIGLFTDAVEHLT